MLALCTGPVRYLKWECKCIIIYVNIHWLQTFLKYNTNMCSFWFQHTQLVPVTVHWILFSSLQEEQATTSYMYIHIHYLVCVQWPQRNIYWHCVPFTTFLGSGSQSKTSSNAAAFLGMYNNDNNFPGCIMWFLPIVCFHFYIQAQMGVAVKNDMLLHQFNLITIFLTRGINQEI